MQNSVKYQKAEDSFNRGNYTDAFNLFKSISDDDKESDENRSDSLNMMGVIVLFDTSVARMDESGIYYFLKSLDFNPNNIGALFNVIENFGFSINNHRDINAFDFALNKFNDMHYHFSSEEMVMLENKIKIRESMNG